jgi:hypothetical protein
MMLVEPMNPDERMLVFLWDNDRDIITSLNVIKLIH